MCRFIAYIWQSHVELSLMPSVLITETSRKSAFATDVILNLYFVFVFILQPRPLSSSTVHSQFSRVIGGHTSDPFMFKKPQPGRKNRYALGIQVVMLEETNLHVHLLCLYRQRYMAVQFQCHYNLFKCLSFQKLTEFTALQSSRKR